MTLPARQFDLFDKPSDGDRMETYRPLLNASQRAVFDVFWSNRGKRFTLLSLQDAAQRLFGAWLGEPTVSAKLRDLRKVPCGDWPIHEARIAPGRNTRVYWLGAVGDTWTAVKARGEEHGPRGEA